MPPAPQPPGDASQPPGVLARLIAASVVNLQQHVGVMTSTDDTRAAGAAMVEAHKTATATFEKIAIALDSLDKFNRTVHTSGGRKPLSESRCVNSLKTLGSDKLEFKNWNEKLINATSQTFGTHWRKFMKSLNQKLDQDRKVLDDVDVDLLDGAGQLDDLKRLSEELYYVLVEKTEGDAGLRVNSGETGEGLQAYMRLYLWFAGITGLALTEKTRELMHPNPVKH